MKFNDRPLRYRGNVDVADRPFDRHLGDTPAMTADDEADIIASCKPSTTAMRATKACARAARQTHCAIEEIRNSIQLVSRVLGCLMPLIRVFRMDYDAQFIHSFGLLS